MGKGYLSLIFYVLVAADLNPSTAEPQELPGHEAVIKGLKAFNAGEYEEAFDEFQRAEAALPNDPDIPFFIGRTYLDSVKPEEAIPYFEKTIEMDPNYWNAYFQLGTALMADERPGEALQYLDKLYKVQPDREDLACLIGMANYKLKRYDDALRYLDASTTSDRMRDVAGLYKGLSYQKQGRSKEARVELSNIYTLEPTSPISEPARRLFDALKMEERIKRPYQFSATYRSLYDDNVRLIPRENVLGVGHARASFGEQAILHGEYSLINRPDYEFNLSYGFSQTIYNSDRKFDVQDHTPGLSFVYSGEIGPLGYSPRVDYFFDWVFLGRDWFLSRHTARPSLTLTMGPHLVTLLVYTFEHLNFRSVPDFRQDDRDGVLNEIGFTQFFRTADARHYIKLGYYKSWASTIGSNWDYDANNLLAGIKCTLPKKVRLNVDYSWEDRDYPHENIFFYKKRGDTERILNVSFSRDIGSHVTAFGGYLRRDNNSNIALYDFEKNTYSLGITYRH